MTLARAGKSLILVTILVTLILVLPPSLTMSPSQGPAQRGLIQSYVTGNWNISYILAMSLAGMFVVLFFLAIQGKRIGAETPNTKSLAISNKMRKGDPDVMNAPKLANTFHPFGNASRAFVPHEKNQDWRVESSLVGSTLRMYWSLLCRKQGAVGLREIQRELGFSSPSSAVYQLDKLMSLGLVRKDDMGDYIVRRIIKVGFLRDFVFIRGYPLPKSALFGALTLLIDLTCFVILVHIQVQIIVSLLAMSPGLISSLIFWYDGFRAFVHKQRLIGRSSNRDD